MSRYIYSIFILLLIFQIDTLSQTILKIQEVERGREIITGEIPVFSAFIKAEVDGVQRILNLEDISIIEDNRSTVPFEISQPGTGNWQLVKWITVVKGFLDFNFTTFYAKIDNEIAKVTGDYYEPDHAKVVIRNYYGQQIQDLSLGYSPIGEETVRQVNVSAIVGKHDFQGRELPVMVDSVTFGKPEFRYLWQGNAFNTTPPPVKVETGAFNLVDVYFRPQSRDYIRDVMTVHYANGMEEKLNVTGNYFPLASNTLLELVQPNGGEVLRPCEVYTIKWKNYARGIPTIVEFSSNGGAHWDELGYSNDSTFQWWIPKIFSDKVLIRVRQDFKSTEVKNLTHEGAVVQKIAYNRDGSELISVNKSGEVFSWDLDTYTQKKKYITGVYSYYQTIAKGLNYLSSDDSRILLAYEVSGEDSLAFFNIDEDGPYLKVPVPDNYDTKEMFVDSRREFIVLIPEEGSRLMVLSTEDGSFIRYVDFNYPVWSIAFNPKLDKASVYQINGEISILDLPDFTITDVIKLDNVPIVTQMGLSPDGKLLSVGCTPPSFSAEIPLNTEIHVIDIETKQIIRSVRNTASEPKGLEFSPVSTVLLVGSEAVPQIAMWDLITGEYIGELGGGQMVLTDFRFSPEGHSIAVSTENSRNVSISTFTYPERDASDTLLTIGEPILSIPDVEINDAYIASINNYEFTAHVCNNGIVPVTFEQSLFKHGIHFTLADIDTISPVTLEPGECFDVRFTYQPRDTGKVTDSLMFISECMGYYYLPLESYSIARNLSFTTETFEFGELCVGDTTERVFGIITNNDPVPVVINAILFDDWVSSPFSLARPLVDTIIEAGATLRYPILFHPVEIGPNSRDLVVYHSYQDKMVPRKQITGKGIGTVVSQSHIDLRFIPEIRTRKITLTNRSNSEVYVNNADIQPDNNFRMLTSLPLVIPVDGNVEIEIEWYGSTEEEAILSLILGPCASDVSIYLRMYRGSSELSIPVVEADPKAKNTVIPIYYKNIENGGYNGERFFETEISINPRLFFPTEVTSEYGSGEILRNDVVDGRRIVGVRVSGNFPSSGTAANVHGVAGIAETDTTQISVVPNSVNWGAHVQTTSSSGLLKIINLNGRRVLHDNNNINVLSIAPNPARDEFTVEFESLNVSTASISVVNSMGMEKFRYDGIEVRKGHNQFKVKSASIPSGTYRLMIVSGNNVTSESLIIVR